MISSEFKAKENFINLFEKHKLFMGRMISGSKSSYKKVFPENDVIFNANIISESHGKIWYGDLDITFDRLKLEKISEELGEPLYVLYEHDARFGSENESIKILINKAAFKI